MSAETERLTGFAVIVVLMFIWLAIYLWRGRLGGLVMRRRPSKVKPDTTAFDRHVKEAIAVCDWTPEVTQWVEPGLHPVLGIPCTVLHTHPSVAREAEAILEAGE